ncbi:MAG: transposase [Cyanobacteria bacterium P01_C01_bin.120]
MAPLTYEGYCNRAVFETWLEEQLLPALPYGSVLICDNASFHKGGRIEALIQQAGCSLLYLPPYSPDLNPIEHQWFVLKNRMRKRIQSGQPFRQVVDQAFIDWPDLSADCYIASRRISTKSRRQMRSLNRYQANCGKANSRRF